MATHFPLTLRWEGTTTRHAAGEHTRAATASVPGKPDLAVSAAGPYGGDDARWNPEDLLGASLATCHMLTFLALARKARLDVRGYEDAVQVVLDSVERVTRVTEVRLSPTIRVAPGTDAGKVRELFEKAHKYCFIGLSLTAAVRMEPTVVEGDAPAS
jgi:organic hydroperoxide reductase OsmC/OhrA